MIATILLVFAWSSAFLRSVLIAFINPAHWNAVTGSSADLPSRRGHAILGGLLPLLTIVLAVLRDGWGMGSLFGPLLIASAIATIIAILAVRPGVMKMFRPFASCRP